MKSESKDKSGPVVRVGEEIQWHSPTPHNRYMSLLFERDITPTKSMAAGVVTLPPGEAQPKLSVHEVEEIYFILQGKGKFVLDEMEYEVERHTAIYVAPGTKHRAYNTSEEEMLMFFVNCPSCFGPVGGVYEFMKEWTRVR
jgi:mannose-6-phosphate isomerase-like protein (cupin superfamily)